MNKQEAKDKIRLALKSAFYIEDICAIIDAIEPDAPKPKEPPLLAELNEHSGVEYVVGRDGIAAWHRKHDRLLLKAIARIARKAFDRGPEWGGYRMIDFAEELEEAAK